MPTPPLFRATPVLTVLLALSLTGCSLLAEEEPVVLPASAISPDTTVTCEDVGDCGEAGAVRWSLPLEGDFYVERSESSAPVVQPAGVWLDHGHPYPRAVESEGVLYLSTSDTVTAVDTADAEVLWTQALGREIGLLRMVGPTLVAHLPEYGGDVEDVRFLEVDRDGARVFGADLPEDFEHLGAQVTSGSHLLFREYLPPDDESDPRYYLVEAATGKVDWSVSLPRADAHLLVGDTAYLKYDPEDARAHVVAVTGGEPGAEFDAPEEAGDASLLLEVPDGPILFDTPGCAPFGSGCDGERITAVDPAGGEVLWSHTEPGEVVSVSVDDQPLVYVRDEVGYRALDAGTGEVLAEDDEVAPAGLLPEFGAESGKVREEMALEEYDLLPITPTGPGVDAEPLDGLAVGAEHLTAYAAPDGPVVGVYLGCAPDGVGEASMGAAIGGAPCTAPRLFTVDH
ncbi:outer membrane protein assembly factor BamB family protein [Nocardiopsis ganjiahuensis]|uniref:outer membrane protein assembly factor BamB family protein n=1 Tax=Nocardiopsis ganjiahuensis TaxID=239984 RepID=UPI000346948B|nr:PQQ-binding-like beta-propeller repeat protein [Nocardiopsis ganjiahuensis]